MALKLMFKYILILIVSLSIISCNEIKNKDKDSKKGNKMLNIIPYGTDEYNAYLEKNAKISKEEALKIKNDFVKTNYPDAIKGAFLSCIINDNFVFTNYFIPKLMESSTKGIWVNIKNGKVTYYDKNTKIPLITKVWNGLDD